MLDLAGLPIYSRDRDERFPLVIGGGSVVFNPEPVAPFFDLFYIGEAENGILELVEKYRELKDNNQKKKEILFELNKLPGVYVPALYNVDYNEEGKITGIRPKAFGVKEKIRRQVISNLDQAFYPTKMIVPYMSIVDRKSTRLNSSHV